MIKAETILLEAVRTYLRDELLLDDKYCEIELDDVAPATTATEYFAISPAGTSPGKDHDSAGTVWDYSIGVRIASMTRLANVPRDRYRSVFLNNLSGVNARLTEVLALADFGYRINQIATAAANDTGGIGGKFLEPLRMRSIDTAPKLIVADPYDAKPSSTPGTPNIAIVRGVNFMGCRYLNVREEAVQL